MKFYLPFFFMCYSLVLFGQGNKGLENFENLTDQFFKKYVVNGFVDYKVIGDRNEDLKLLLRLIEDMEISAFSDAEKQAFYINTYNLLVIDQIVNNYPKTSVKEIPGFFNRVKYKVGGESITLDKIEKDILLNIYKDSRFHFVLVCGAKDCPELWDQAVRSSTLDAQLTDRTKVALNDSEFIRVTDKGYELSEIFRWNRFEFGSKSDIIEFINTYRDAPLDLKKKSSYYTYDWTLNDVVYKDNTKYNTANNSFRYVTSAAIPKEGIEIKIFNNLYSQQELLTTNDNLRSTYFTTSISFLYGSSSRFNIGFVSRYRRVRNSVGSSSPFDVFESANELNSNSGFTAFGPQIRWAPSKKWTNLSIQSSFTVPLSSNLSGGIDSPFLDWSGPVFITQVFNDKSIGDKFSLFTEIDFLIEEIGGSNKANRVSTPVTIILSWFPIKNFTVYGLAGYSPYLVKPYDYFTQFGIGMKYQLSPNFEIEILATDFSNRYLNSLEGSAVTYNLGFRYSR